MKPMDTEMNNMEKGEDTHLLDADLVKPLRASKKKVRKPFSLCGCLCWTLAILLGLLLATLTLVAAGSYFFVRHNVKRFTTVGMDDLPQPPLPVTPIATAELDILKDEAKLFWDQLRAGVSPTQDLVITQDHLNGLIASSDFLRGHAYVKLSQGSFDTELVLPADKLPGGKGRYFAGRGHVDVLNSYDDGTHVVTKIVPKYPIKELDYADILLGKFLVYEATDREDERKKTPLVELDFGQFLNWVAPQDWIDRRENLLSCNNIDNDDDDFDRRDCQEFMATLGRLESIALQDEKIVFTPIRRPAGANGESVVLPAADGGVHRRLDEMGAVSSSSFRRVLARSLLRGLLF